jgi:hypothetical protein
VVRSLVQVIEMSGCSVEINAATPVLCGDVLEDVRGVARSCQRELDHGGRHLWRSIDELIELEWLGGAASITVRPRRELAIKMPFGSLIRSRQAASDCTS